MKDKKYDLNLYQALEIVVKGGAVRGDDFADGIFLKLNSYGQLITMHAGRTYLENVNVFLRGMAKQKFRSLSAIEIKDLVP